MAPGRFVFVKSRSKTHIVFLSSETLTGDARDVQRVVRQILNKSTGNRLIPKQECMVLLAGLDLVKCSDTIDTVSVSGHARIMKKKKTKRKKQRFWINTDFVTNHTGICHFMISITTKRTWVYAKKAHK